MHNPDFIMEKETQKLLWDFEGQTDHLISARWQHLAIANRKKRTCQIVDFAIPADHRVKLEESEENDEYLNLNRELEKYGKWR